MPRIDDNTKQQRLERIHILLARNARGVTEGEIADEINLERRTVNNYLRELEDQGKAFKDGIYWFPLVLGESRLRPFDLTPEEAVTLYLGARLLGKQQDKRNEPAESALMKLAGVLKADAGVGDEIEQAARELAQRPVQENYQPIFRDVVRGYIYRKKIEIAYRPLNWNKPFQTTFSTYLLEPSPIGFTTYLIGHSSIVNALRAYKLERIESAHMVKDDYSIPPDFPGLEILRNAWSIVMGGEIVRVVLRFSPQVKNRVLETRWHPSQQSHDDPERPGFLIWEVRVADTMDLIPWIRGWGADCEVLEPRELREALVREAMRLAEVYRVVEATTNNTIKPVEDKLLWLWGKTQYGNTDSSHYHPALFHMLDVAFVSQYLLNDDAPPRLKNILSQSLGVSPETLVDWLPYLVALHDIGKVSIAFQRSNNGQKDRLTHNGFSFNDIAQQDIHHSLASQVYVEKLSKLSPKMSQTWSEAVGGHHGRFSHPDEVKKGRAILDSETPEWNSYRESADAILQNIFLKQDLSTLPDPIDISIAIMAINGFMILCDWIGSDSRYFKLEPNLSFDSYVSECMQRAKLAVESTGLLISSTSEAPADVHSLLADLSSLRSLQILIDDIPDEFLTHPTLSIIEAPTGEGKTEAALALAHRIGRITGVDDMYYALPTTATSNQMFGRLQEHLKNRLRLSSLVKLVHGQAYLVEDDLRAEFPSSMIAPLENGESSHEESLESVAWFNSKKRALLAPFGVGTIDQAELAVLNVKHVGLRMSGLAGKVLIIDEVHAYDTYMTTIIERLLRWLSSMNTSVILLSATLPISRRKQLAEAYCKGVVLDDQSNKTYPNLLLIKNKVSEEKTAWTPNQEIKVWQPNRVLEINSLHFTDDDEQVLKKAKWLIDQARNGGCACWITNTVKRSQNIYEAVDKLKKEMVLDIELDLIHSQFPLSNRQDKEIQLKDKYGRKGDKRPKRGIVIGTQVLEQSLDLDFDVMVSDLAPIDLLLQRVGRLHRHERSNRPFTHDKPRFFINFETDPEGGLKLGSDRRIYDEYIIRATHREIAKRIAKKLPIILPADYRALIEIVYATPDKSDPLYDEWLELDSKDDRFRKKAREKLLPEPHPRVSFAETAAMKIKFEEEENSAAWIVAQTRLGEKTLNVIPLERDGDWVYLDDGIKVNVKAEAGFPIQRKLLKNHLRISNPDAIVAIESDAKEHGTALFRKSTLLKDYFPIWLSKGETSLPKEKPDIHIKLDLTLGLTIRKEKKINGTTK